ncbi:MAG: sigma-70 family RNA polymerase sigma factor [Candidatus Riflebacteria bacterium]|nr:sigma-70 family RNA polymerase sigma factor [Candidatus Riflebacteria bacterium]
MRELGIVKAGNAGTERQGPDDADGELVDRAQAEDRGAFEELCRRHSRQISRQILRMTHSSHDLEELTQEVLYQALRGLPSFRRGSRFTTWLFRITANVALQYLRRRGRRGTDVPYEDAKHSHLPPPRAGGTRGPEEAAAYRELCVGLSAAVDLLPANQRAVAVLGSVQGHSYREMSEILGLTEGMVKGRLHRALVSLRAHLSAFGPTPPATAPAAS